MFVEFSTLMFDEPVRLDTETLGTLHRQLGPAGAENVISRALEELAARMIEVHALYAAGKSQDLAKLSRSLVAIAAQIGMTRFAQVAQDVSHCAGQADATALGATVARLDRLADQSLLAIWDLQDMRI